MKNSRIIFLIVSVLFFSELKAQMNFIGDLNGATSVFFDEIAGEEINMVFLFDSGNMYDNNEVNIYDKNFNLRKNIRIPKETGRLGLIEYVDLSDSYNKSPISKIGTTDFFNDDELFEFLVYKDDGNTNPYLAVINENNQILWKKEWTDGYSIYCRWTTLMSLGVTLKKSKSGSKFMFVNLQGDDRKTEVYAITGNLSSIQMQKIAEFTAPYPNPSKDNITLPYDLKGAENGVMRIFSTSGVEVKSLIVTGSEKQLQLQVSDFLPGNYFYTVSVNNETVGSNRFIVN
ncbi:MAG: T9SS type A sorting domain-containing protein [Candidatus Azobacteroides sp.]|nr:T9SS type A sorting domain-containing protein [Candidatus Azobacteroides sp.]